MALAVPVYRQVQQVRQSLPAVIVAAVAGSLTAAAIGVALHGIGSARGFQVNEVAGAFSGLAMGLNALAAAILIPVLYRLLF